MPILHLYIYGSRANFLFLGPTVLIYINISKEWRCNEGLRGVGIYKIEQVIRYLRRFS